MGYFKILGHNFWKENSCGFYQKAEKLSKIQINKRKCKIIETIALLICNPLHDIIIHSSIQTCVHCPKRRRGSELRLVGTPHTSCSLTTAGGYIIYPEPCLVWNTIQTEQYKPSLSPAHVAPSLPCDHHALSKLLTDRKHHRQPSIYRCCLSLLPCS